MAGRCWRRTRCCPARPTRCSGRCRWRSTSTCCGRRSCCCAGRRGQSLDTTGLVHEVYLKLSAGANVQLEDRGHLLAVTACAMRHIIISRARTRGAVKRGGGQAPVDLDPERLPAQEQAALAAGPRLRARAPARARRAPGAHRGVPLLRRAERGQRRRRRARSRCAPCSGDGRGRGPGCARSSKPRPRRRPDPPQDAGASRSSSASQPNTTWKASTLAPSVGRRNRNRWPSGMTS